MRDETATGLARVAILSSAGGGGGGIAARRLAEAIRARPGWSARLIGRDTLGEFLPKLVAPMTNMNNHSRTNTHFTVEYPGYTRDWLVDYLAQYDVVNVHWASYLIGLAEIDALARAGTRVLLTLHDFYHITGGCHYPAGCTGMTRGCLVCPQVDARLCDASFVPLNLRLKQGLLARPNVHLTAPSRYLRDAAVATGIVPEARAHLLRNPYLPLDEAAPWPGDAPLRIVVVADSLGEQRKGMQLALASLNRFAGLLRQRHPGQFVMVHLVGHAEPALRAALDRLQLAHRLHGRIADHRRLVDLFSISDIVLSCSFEDNWPNVLVEAGSYGAVPVVGPGHGCEEFARHFGIGVVTPGYSADAFAEGLLQAFEARPGAAARDAAAARIRADHAPAAIAGRFAEIVSGMA